MDHQLASFSHSRRASLSLTLGLLLLGCGEGSADVSDAAFADAGWGGGDTSARTGDAGLVPADGRDPATGDGGEGARPFTFVVLPDTQFYAIHYPEIFESQTRWIMTQKTTRDISLVLHLGDIVDTNLDEREWMVASRMLHTLDGVVPYVLAAGNHDTIPNMRAAPLMNRYFPVSMFMTYPWWRGTFEKDQVQNSFQIVQGGGREWLILSLEFGPRDEVLAWAAELLTRYANLPAILITHAYLHRDDQRYDWARFGTKQDSNPHSYPILGSVNDGEEMWTKLVSRFDNVKLVLSGHVALVTAGRKTSVRASGSRVHELLVNFQLCYAIPTRAAGCPLPNSDPSFHSGGGGFLRIMTLDAAGKSLAVKTYSPFLDEWKTSAEHEFTLELD